MKRTFLQNLDKLVNLCYEIGKLEQVVFHNATVERKKETPAFKRLRFNRLVWCKSAYREIVEESRIYGDMGYKDLTEYKKKLVRSMYYPLKPQW